MPDPRPKLESANDTSTSDEASKLELYLQKQLEEDVARIFDESIYSDIELVCGKLKILTHSCILKARTKKFYSKLEAIFHVNIEKETFDEIYSFISDAYTECDIKTQEEEIFALLKNTIFTKVSDSKKADIDENDIFSTPSCTSPYTEKTITQISNCSPSKELTKEYYALVHIEGNLLEKEIIEQDALSNAFQTIIKSQDKHSNKTGQHTKPTSLSLISSHSSITTKHSNNCDIKSKIPYDFNSVKDWEKLINAPFETNERSDCTLNKNNETTVEKTLEITYSPDSLIVDDPSSSSDYLSAAYTCSPALGSYGFFSPLNVGDNSTKMENTFTSSDSGVDNTGMVESVSSHKDIAMTDVSLTENSLLDLTITNTDETTHLHEFNSSPEEEFNQAPKTTVTTRFTASSPIKYVKSCDSSYVIPSKEEKQRQNEEIVILESSSLSSETGSWESVFPPKLSDKQMSDKFIQKERQYGNEDFDNYEKFQKLTLHTSSPYFKDAANSQTNDTQLMETKSELLTIPSEPMPCTAIRRLDFLDDINDDESLERKDKNAAFIPEDLSPTIFEMTPITEEPLNTSISQITNTTSTSKKVVPLLSDPINRSLSNILMSSQTNSLKNNVAEENKNVDTISKETLSYVTQGNCAVTDTCFKHVNQETSTDSKNNEKVLVNQLTPYFIDAVNFKNSDTQILKSKPIIVPSDLFTGLPESNHRNESFGHSGKGIDFKGKDLSPTIKVATPVDSSQESDNAVSLPSSTIYMSTTPHNSIMSLQAPSLKHFASNEIKNVVTVSRENVTFVRNGDCNESSIVSGDTKIKHVDLRNVVDKHNSSFIYENVSPKNICASAWVVDMSTNSKNPENNVTNMKPNERNAENLRNEAKGNENKSRSPVDSDSSEKSGHKFYIDLSTLPDPLPPEKPKCSNEKRNIFSMYIDLGEKSTLKEMPSRLSCSSTKQITDSKIKHLPKNPITNPANNIIGKEGKSIHSTFEKCETLCNDPNISISEIIAISKTSKCSKTIEVDINKNNAIDKIVCQRQQGDETEDLKHLNVTLEENINATDLFVKLSDLDKPIQKWDIFERECIDMRMTRSIPDKNWTEQNIDSEMSRSALVKNTFHSENALTLYRLFPNLKKELSKSMPSSLCPRARPLLRYGTSSNVDDTNEQASEVSESRSGQSNMNRSIIDNSTAEETSQTSSLISNCQSKLGQDLLRMFLEEIAPDVTVVVAGKRIKAHKCILSSRCQYFAGMLSGGWVESAGNVITLPSFAYNVVHFAMCHIYSGLSTIPDSVSIVELAIIADMLGLEGLKEAIMLMLKAKYCHYFHKPCDLCISGVLECFPLSAAYGLDDLYFKCLRWITKYFTKVWPTKAFATLPKDLLEKCYQEHIVNLTIDNFIETVFGCGITVASLQSSRWAESVVKMCRRLVNAAAHFAAPRLLIVVELIFATADVPNSAKQALDECLTTAIEWALPEEICRLYAYLCNIMKEMKNQYASRPDQSRKVFDPNNLYTHASSWRLQCEGALARAAHQVVGSQAFSDLPPELRRRLRELGCIMYDTQTPFNLTPVHDRKSKSTYTSKPQKMVIASTTRSLDMEEVRNCFVPYTSKPVPVMGPKDDRRLLSKNNQRNIIKPNKDTVPAVRTTKAQEQRAKFNQCKTLSTQSINNKPARILFENTKPRYLEPRLRKSNEKKATPKKLNNKAVSSSESSRISSPINSRNLRTCRLNSNQKMDPKPHTLSQDSLATTSRPRTAEPSTDSLSESQKSNKYATYTKTKHTNKGSTESVIPRYQGSLVNNTIKTKIPVYNNSNTKSVNGSKPSLNAKISPINNQTPNCNIKGKIKSNFERKISGSLMSATKSSLAKIVPKTSKDCHSQCSRSSKQQKVALEHAGRREIMEKEPKIPAIERSGTFLKDEPTFGNKDDYQ